jgi:hypothetical protein
MKSGSFIGIVFLILFAVIAIIFVPIIFGNTEAEMDRANMTEQQNQSYNATTNLIQVSVTGMNIIVWFLILAGIIVALYLLSKA